MKTLAPAIGLATLMLMTVPVLGQNGGPVPIYPDRGVPATTPEDRPLPPESVVAGLSKDAVAITANFDGSDILIYAAIRRETPIPPGPPIDAIITLEGPAERVTVRKRARRLGIWVNTEQVQIGAAPSFYAVATTGPLDKILAPGDDIRNRISIPLAVRSFGGPLNVDKPQEFSEALVRLREKSGAYILNEGGIKMAEQTLFRADVRLPANLVEGIYRTRIFLLRHGLVVDAFQAGLPVEKVGLERWLYKLGREQPFLYGLMSLFIAVAAGWSASAAFRLIQRK
ncbi:TIGR02186 family protein [Paracoccus pacificus]|uniref:TIGR02186 family protein n=1 Tax=Paracoccus pacificus TaxID=1463598 RepID=A0ABW4RB63_9RHOB